MKEVILSGIGQVLCWITDKFPPFVFITGIYMCTLYVCGYDKSEDIM